MALGHGEVWHEWAAAPSCWRLGAVNGVVKGAGGAQKEGPVGFPISIQVGARVLLGSPFPVLEEPPYPKWERNTSRTLWAALARWARNTMGQLQARWATFACMGFLCSCCLGNLNGSLFGFGVCVPVVEKMEQRQIL